VWKNGGEAEADTASGYDLELDWNSSQSGRSVNANPLAQKGRKAEGGIAVSTGRLYYD